MASSANKSTGGRRSSSSRVDISVFDANKNKPSASSSWSNTAATANSSHHGTGSYYADDDSVVSSNVSYVGAPRIRAGSSSSSSSDDDDGGRNQEVVTLTRAAQTPAVETAVESGDAPGEPPKEREGAGILPRSRREWCIVCLAILLILAVALGTGLGLGFLFMNKGDTPAKNERDTGNDGGAGPPVASGDATTPTRLPTYAPSSAQDSLSDNGTLPRPVQPPSDDLASAIEYHVIAQEISDLTSFAEMASGGGGNLTAQTQARDFLVLRDWLPLTVGDEEGDGPSNADGDDDLLAITGNDPMQKRPYLTTATPAYRVAQRYATAVLYHATDGPNWEMDEMWLEPGVHECDFIGVTCEETVVPAVTLKEAMESPDEVPHHDDDEGGDGSMDTTRERMIVAIDLPENNIGGSLPQEITALPYLRRLGLWSNRIGGSLPTQLGSLTRLTSLHLDDNALVGNIPRQFGQMSEVTDLFLENNKGVVGRIPSELGNLSKLERLRLANMSLRGPMPTTLGKLTNLVDLSLQNNRLNRKLPEELGNLVNLQLLMLSGNSFTGDIPTSWRSMAKLKKLEIETNEKSFDVDERLCLLRDNTPVCSCSFESMPTDCQGYEPRDTSNLCTYCLP